MKQLIKKHYMVLVALFIAGVTMMSFTLQTNQRPNDDEIWFLMNAAGTAITTTQTTNPNACLDPSGDDCVRSYAPSQTEPVPGSTTGEIRVKPLEVNSYINARGKE